MFIDGGVIGRALYGLFKHGNGLFYVAIYIMRPSQRILDRWIIGLQPARFLYERQSLIDILPTLYLRVAEIIQNHGLIRRQLVGPFQLCPGFVPLSCRSEEHTSELQSLMRISYAVFCLKKKKNIAST